MTHEEIAAAKSAALLKLVKKLGHPVVELIAGRPILPTDVVGIPVAVSPAPLERRRGRRSR